MASKEVLDLLADRLDALYRKTQITDILEIKYDLELATGRAKRERSRRKSERRTTRKQPSE